MIPPDFNRILCSHLSLIEMCVNTLNCIPVEATQTPP